MTAAPIASPRAHAPRPRLDAVLEFLYRVERTTVHVRSEFPFPLQGDRLDIPFAVWKDWQRVRLRVRPDGPAPRTQILLQDLHGNPLSGGRAGVVRRLGKLDVDLVRARDTGMAFALVIAGPGNVVTIQVFLGLGDRDADFPGLAAFGLHPLPPRVLEVP